jgi:hypothetical protein
MDFLNRALQRLWFGCGGHCHEDHAHGVPCPVMERADREREQLGQAGNPFCYGLPLVCVAMLVFLFPLMLGIICSRLAEHWLGPVFGLGEWWQVPGLFAGFAGGVIIGRAVVAFVIARCDRRVSAANAAVDETPVAGETPVPEDADLAAPVPANS